MAEYTPLHKSLKDLNTLIYQHPIDIEYGVKDIVEKCAATEDSLWKITIPKKVFQLYTENESGEDHSGRDTFTQLYTGIQDKHQFSQKYWASWWLSFSKTKPFHTTDVRVDMNRKYEELLITLWNIKPKNYKNLLQKEPGINFLFEKNVLEDAQWVKNIHKLKNNKAIEVMREWWDIGVELTGKKKTLLDFTVDEKLYTFKKIADNHFLEPWFLRWQEKNYDKLKANQDWWGITLLYVASTRQEGKKYAIDTLLSLSNQRRLKQFGQWVGMLENPNENDKKLKNQFGARFLEFIQLRKNENTPVLERIALSIHHNKESQKQNLQAL